MYKISEVRIDAFWHRFDVQCRFEEDVNIIIGENGTGKTTFMNILYSVLAVDIEGLYENDFDEVEIKLIHKGAVKTIRAKKSDNDELPFLYVNYQVSREKFKIRCLGSEDGPIPLHYRRKAYQESYALRETLSEFVSLASLSVYRTSREDHFDVRDRQTRKLLSPVDMRLSDLMNKLTQYELELSQQSRKVSDRLQKEVLTSLLYDKSEKDQQLKLSMEFDKKTEKHKLTAAYTQLKVIDADVRKRINEHVDAIEDTLSQFASSSKTQEDLDFSPLEAYARTRYIIELSLDAEKEINDIYTQVNLFLMTISEFIKDKKFTIVGGELLAENTRNEDVPLTKLSSGEKQLLILLIEALLQDNNPFIFLADEPELSLHISWQRKILPAVMGLNANAQVIVATHSPEIAGKIPHSKIIDMQSMFNG